MTSRSLTLGLVLLGSMAALRAETPPADQPLTPYETALLDYKTGHYEAASTAIDAAEKASPGDPATEILKSRILTELGDFVAAEKTLIPLGVAPASPDVLLALGDLNLRKRSFDKAAKIYEGLLAGKPGDPDLILKLIYSRIGASDLVSAAKYASQLKPLDPDHPSYYFAKAALAQATGKTQEADDDIQTARTIYGSTVATRYLKTYLEVVSSSEKNADAAKITPPPILTNAPPADSKP